MNKQITIRFEKDSNIEFVGEDCIGKYEQYIIGKLSEALDAEVKLTSDSPMGTRVEGEFQSPSEEQEDKDIVHDVLNRAGNNLAEICN